MEPLDASDIDGQTERSKWGGAHESTWAANEFQAFTSSTNDSQQSLKLLVHDLDLFIYHSTGEAIDRHVYPVMLLPFDYKVILKATAIGLEMTCLGDHINYQIPRARLRHRRQCARNNFPSSLNDSIRLLDRYFCW